jgi:two-component system nitrate/nitrite response regulator NarL
MIVSQQQKIRIVIADDHSIFLDGLKMLLDVVPEFCIVGEAHNGDDALTCARTLLPDVLLLDVFMPGPPVAQTLQQLSKQCPSVRTILLTAMIEANEVAHAMTLGAQGLVSKDTASESLFRAIHAVVEDRFWMTWDTKERLVHALLQGRSVAPESRRASSVPCRPVRGETRPLTVDETTPGPFRLTPREIQIVKYVVSGRSNRDIAENFEISECTVKHHLARIFDKVGVFNRLELAMFAMSHRLAEDSDDASDPTHDARGASQLEM